MQRYRYQKQLQQWLESKSEPDIMTWMDIGTAHELIARLEKHPEAYDDDYIGTFAKILEAEIESYYNPPDPNAPEDDF